MIEKVHPEIRNAAGRIPNFDLSSGLTRWCVRRLITLRGFLQTKRLKANVSVSTIRLEKSSIRLYQPTERRSDFGILWIHGGGMVLGNALMDDACCCQFADELGCVVVSVDYRLAPEHPFPSALEDCMSSWSWFLQQAPALGIRRDRIAILGQSAGGGIAASLCLKIRDEESLQPAFQGLIYPMLDDRASSNVEQNEHLVWNHHQNAYGWSAYLGQPIGCDAAAEYAVPARATNLSGLPPTWIGVGNLDLFYEEDIKYAQRLKDAGVLCDLHIVDGAPHGFFAFAPEAHITNHFRQSLTDFLRRAIGTIDAR